MPKKNGNLIWNLFGIGQINRKLDTIMATQDELAQKLTSVSDELDKATKEIKDAIANAGASTPAVDAAVARLEAAAKTLDDLNPDATT